MRRWAGTSSGFRQVRSVRRRNVSFQKCKLQGVFRILLEGRIYGRASICDTWPIPWNLCARCDDPTSYLHHYFYGINDSPLGNLQRAHAGVLEPDIVKRLQAMIEAPERSTWGHVQIHPDTSIPKSHETARLQSQRGNLRAGDPLDSKAELIRPRMASHCDTATLTPASACGLPSVNMMLDSYKSTFIPLYKVTSTTACLSASARIA